MTKRLQIGDVYSVALPDGKFAFGRVMRENAVQFFGYTDNKGIELATDNMKISFTVYVYPSSFKDDRMQYVENVPFGDIDDSWAPLTYSYDPVFGKYSTYFRGKMIPVRKRRAKGLSQRPPGNWSI